MNLKLLWTISGSMGTGADIKMLKNIKDLNIDVISSDIYDKDGIGFALTGKKYILPSGKDPGYIDSVLNLCEMEKITTIIPQYGEELVPLSRNMGLFEEKGVKVLVTEDTEKLKIANSKKGLYDYFKREKYVPRYGCADTLNSLESVIYNLGYPDVPVCVKPAFGEGGRGFRIVTEEKVDMFDSGTGVSKLKWGILKEQLKEAPEIPELMVMEYLPGTEYSVDCVCKSGEALICIPRQRIETSMGVATVSLIEKNDELIEISREIISKLNLSYNINIQFKYSSSEEPKLLEINPRVSGSLVANCGAGVNMLELSLKLAYGLPLGDIDVKWGTKMIRYWDQVFI